MTLTPPLTLHHAGKAGAPVLVLGNSLGTDRRLWQPTIEALGEDFHIVCFDPPGHGGQADLPIATLGDLATQLIDAIDAAGIGPFRYCGVSMGAAIGIELALAAPHRLRALVLANTAARFAPTADARQFWQGRIDTVTRAGAGAIADATIARWLTPAHVARQPDLQRWLAGMFSATAPAGYAACAGAVMAFDRTAAVAAIDVPTLVIAGTEDLATPPALGQQLHRAIDGSRYLELPVAHLAPLGAPEAFHTAVRAFLLSPNTQP
ncbi:alpha/beta fold hydrolase [Cupriavidus plantarum]|uniref:alpha/beta fold hydrolase n=1 Tax=Cupriavidus plantarum TaxID=942865 RepID=UPI001B19211B|nr:alpha/beta fold hydrolase [Cupriavidus plantarum]CAG2135044.1 3-oxoadipate enol-lactonase 2 [Cupriavidus plantarum]SMR84509.1 3-oxoadipate enol-lactonase [Cupriavidus plantarum]